MSGRKQVLFEIDQDVGTRFDRFRNAHIQSLAEYTGRNVLVYYAGWLLKGGTPVERFSISDADMAGFMTCCQGVDRGKGLDLVLHTPGGELAATEAVIDYLYSMYGRNIRAIVPQLAMSSGTLISLSCREIVMGSHSSLGPIDPQISGMPAQGVLEEFNQATREVQENPAALELWKSIVGRYWPGLITSCQHASSWSDELLRCYLSRCMLVDTDPVARMNTLQRVSDLLGKQATSRNHSRHVNATKAREAGLRIVSLEEDQGLQDRVLSLHHGLCHTFTQSNVAKIMANDIGATFISELGAM